MEFNGEDRSVFCGNPPDGNQACRQHETCNALRVWETVDPDDELAKSVADRFQDLIELCRLQSEQQLAEEEILTALNIDETISNAGSSVVNILAPRK